MKHSTFVAVLLFLASAVGALTAAWLYIRRREKELDEYERLLFSDEYEDDDDDSYEDEPVYEKIQDEPAAPAEDADAAQDEIQF